MISYPFFIIWNHEVSSLPTVTWNKNESRWDLTSTAQHVRVNPNTDEQAVHVNVDVDEDVGEEQEKKIPLPAYPILVISDTPSNGVLQLQPGTHSVAFVKGDIGKIAAMLLGSADTLMALELGPGVRPIYRDDRDMTASRNYKIICSKAEIVAIATMDHTMAFLNASDDDNDDQNASPMTKGSIMIWLPCSNPTTTRYPCLDSRIFRWSTVYIRGCLRSLEDCTIPDKVSSGLVLLHHLCSHTSKNLPYKNNTMQYNAPMLEKILLLNSSSVDVWAFMDPSSDSDVYQFLRKYIKVNACDRNNVPLAQSP